MADFIRAVWQAAQDLGLTSRWQFWVAVLAVLVLLVMARMLGPPALELAKRVWLYWRSLPPTPDPVEHPPSPPMDASTGSTPDHSGTIPVPGPTGPQPGQGQP